MAEKKYTQEQITANLEKKLRLHLEINIGISLQHYTQGDLYKAFCVFQQVKGIVRLIHLETQGTCRLHEYVDKKAKHYNVSAADYMNAMLDIKNSI